MSASPNSSVRSVASRSGARPMAGANVQRSLILRATPPFTPSWVSKKAGTSLSGSPGPSPVDRQSSQARRVGVIVLALLLAGEAGHERPDTQIPLECRLIVGQRLLGGEPRLFGRLVLLLCHPRLLGGRLRSRHPRLFGRLVLLLCHPRLLLRRRRRLNRGLPRGRVLLHLGQTPRLAARRPG